MSLDKKDIRLRLEKHLRYMDTLNLGAMVEVTLGLAHFVRKTAT